MVFQCEVLIPRTGEWVVLDESTGETRWEFEQSLPHRFPILHSRQWRVIAIDKPVPKTMFTWRVALPR